MINKESIDALLESGLYLNTVFYEIESSVATANMEFIQKQTDKITEENALLGGSSEGYYMDSEYYQHSSVMATRLAQVTPVDDSLFERAYDVKVRRTEITQDMTALANFITVLEDRCEGSAERVANFPPSTFRFSETLKETKDLLTQDQGEGWQKQHLLDRNDPENTVFFLHFDRVEPCINKYVFHALTI